MGIEKIGMVQIPYFAPLQIVVIDSSRIWQMERITRIFHGFIRVIRGIRHHS